MAVFKLIGMNEVNVFRNWALNIISSLSFLVSSSSFASNVVHGQIAIFQDTNPISIEVVLPEFSGGVLQNKLIHFAKLPENIKSDNKGCFCFDLNDERFAFVHTYYYATKALEYYNAVFLKLGLPLLHDLEINLSKDVSLPTTGGYATIKTMVLAYPRPALDISILAHEIGHFVHFNAAGQEIFGNADGKTNMEGVQNLGIHEGTANLLSALFTGSSQIGKAGGFSFDIDNFIRFPDLLISKREAKVRLLAEPIILQNYPAFAMKGLKKLKSIDADLIQSENYALPDPYLSSSVINQPLWRATFQFGIERIKLLYIKTISELRTFSSYSDLANALLKNAKLMNVSLYETLKNDYQVRGLHLTE